MLFYPKKIVFRNLAIASFVWSVILIILKIVNYSGLMSQGTPFYVFLILELFFISGGFFLFYKSKKL